MKRIIAILFAAVSCLYAVLLSACATGGKTTAKLEEVTQTRIVMTVEETDGKATAFDAIKSLRDQDLISFDYTESSYGAYITSINGKAEYVIESTINSSKGYSWMLYTSDMEFAYEETTLDYNGIVCGQSANGASSLIVKAGEIYVWEFQLYDYSW